MKTRRVGSFTFGVVLVIMGCLMLVHLLVPQLTYTFIFRLWPVILILLGLEILVSNKDSDKVTFVYDVPAILLLLAVVLFTVFMGFAQCSMDYYQIHHYLP